MMAMSFCSFVRLSVRLSVRLLHETRDAAAGARAVSGRIAAAPPHQMFPSREKLHPIPVKFVPQWRGYTHGAHKCATLVWIHDACYFRL